MSVSAELWKIATAAPQSREGAVAAVKSADPSYATLDQPLALLIDQVFFPAGVPKRRHILFAAPTEAVHAIGLCETLALALAEQSRSSVAIVGGDLVSNSAKKQPHSVAEASQWRTHSQRITDRVWRLPAWLFRDRVAQENSDQRRPTAEFRRAFDFFLFAAAAGSGELPAFCSMCDAAVLVIAANQTRRDAALDARNQLRRHKLLLLGTVLTDRVFEIPDAIYRRL